MSAEDQTVQKAFSSQYQELLLDDIKVEGEIPSWLSGSFISNGPAQFEVGSSAFTHWFDGFSMLKKFDFQGGKVSFQNRFLQSQQYVQSQALGHLADNEFATYAGHSFFSRVRLSIKSLIKGLQYDNCNVNTSRLGEHFIAMSEMNEVLEFSLKDFNTLGAFRFEDKIQGQLMLAHPHMDFERGEAINVVTEFGREIKYHIVKIPQASQKREILVTLTSKQGFYMHSFSVTPNYIILMKTPLEMNKLKLMLGGPFNQSLEWKEKQSSFFIIIDRRNLAVQEIEVDPFIALHTANAFEKGPEIILDLMAYDHGNPYDFFYLSNLRSKKPLFPEATLRRYILDLRTERARMDILARENPEFPRLNYSKNNGKNYQFLYTTAMSGLSPKFFNIIQKINMQSGDIIRFKKENYYFGEAVFVPKPEASSEDDGVLMFITFNAEHERSTLLILDATSLQAMAEIALPLPLPFGLHGDFYSLG
jgi:beta,beta-carotene 9',10'-dioxygenase